MFTVESSLMSTLLALAAAFLSLSIAVQIFQELWKYLTSSKSRAFRISLEEFLGPWTNDFLRHTEHSSLRGPFQAFRFKPGKTFLPMTRQEFESGLQRMAPAWVRRTMEAIDVEQSLQGSMPAAPSSLWKRFCSDLAAGETAAGEVRSFLEEWGHQFGKAAGTAGTGGTTRTSGSAGTAAVKKLPATLDARQLRIAFRRSFLADVDRTLERLDTFEQNLAYAYKRRNLRQTFTIALLFAFFFNLPFEVLYKKASAVSPEEAAALAQQAASLYEATKTDTTGFADRNQLLADAVHAVHATVQPQGVNYLIDLKTLREIWQSGAEGVTRFLLGLLITALLTSFGAPVWNDVTNLLLRAGKSLRRPADETT